MTIFDKNQCILLKGFLDLKDSCFFYEKECHGEEWYQRNKSLGFACKNFYSSMRAVIDLPIFFLVNEELSNITGRSGFCELWKQIFDISNTRHIEDMEHFQDLINLFRFNYNNMVGSMMLDFHVSAFSVFDNWVNILFEAISEKQREDMLLSRKEKYKKILLSYKENTEENIENEIIEKLMKLSGKYFSIKDKFECIIKNINDNSQNKYGRDLKKDREIIEFLGAKRNTIHNLGINRTGSEKKIELNNREFHIEKNKPYISDNYVDDLKMIEELIKIYTELFKSLDCETRNLYVDFILENEHTYY